MPDLGLRADVGDLNVFGASPCCVSPYIRLWKYLIYLTFLSYIHKSRWIIKWINKNLNFY